MSESEEEEEAVDKVVELVRSPLSLRSPASLAQNGEVQDLFLFDNNIPSIATRIPTSAEPADTQAFRRRNRLLRLISEPWGYSRGLQRSVSVQLDDRRRQRDHSDDLSGGFSTSSGANGGLDEPLLRDADDDDDDSDDDDDGDAEVGGGHEQNQRRGRARGRGLQSNSSLINGSGRARRKKMRSVDACCSGRSDAVTLKRRGMLSGGKLVVVGDHSNDDDNDEASCHLCNGLDEQLKSKSCSPERSNKAN